MNYPNPQAFLFTFIFCLLCLTACNKKVDLSPLNLQQNCNKLVCLIQPNDCDRCLNNLNKFFSQNQFKNTELSILMPDLSQAQKQAFFNQILKIKPDNFNIHSSSKLQQQFINLAGIAPFSSSLLVFNQNDKLTEQYPFKKFTLQNSQLQQILQCP